MPKSKLNIILYSLLFIFAVGINEATSKDKIAFSKSLTKCLKKAQQEDKFIFVYVHTSWSIPCQQMEETTFKDSLVISEINHDYISLSMNAGRNKTFAKDYEVHIFPTLMVMDKWGNAIIRGSGYKDPNSLLELIHRTRSQNRFLKQNIDSLASVLDHTNILQAIDSIKIYKDEYTAKNLAKKYLDKHKKEWGEPTCMALLNEYFTLDKKYLKFVSKNHKAFFLLFDSIRLKENIAFHVFLKSLKKKRGRTKFDYKPLKRWFKRYKIEGYEKMQDFVKIKYLLWGRGPSIRSSIKLIENYPETSNESVLYSSVIRILLKEKYHRKEIDYDNLIEKIESSLEEGTYWRYDVLALLYYKMGNIQKTNECIETATNIADILGEEYTPILDYLQEYIDKSD
ncbi:MAG: thioredoxin family protein [Saprospiraceae bacterium]|nr:thioredoxin family protein [Saprospiraceae bacterium]